MNEPPSSPQKRLSRGMAILIGAFGLVFLLMAVRSLDSLLLAARTHDWATFVQILIPVLLQTNFGLFLVLLPFQQNRVVGKIVAFVGRSLALSFRGGHYLGYVVAPLVSCGFVLLVPELLWQGLEAVGVVPEFGHKAFIYLGLVTASIVVTYFGQAFVRMFLCSIDATAEYTGLLKAFEPGLVRLYIYIVVAAAYVLNSVETFAGATLWNWDVWNDSKDMILAILLTYATIERVINIWDQRKRGAKPGLGISGAK